MKVNQIMCAARAILPLNCQAVGAAQIFSSSAKYSHKKYIIYFKLSVHLNNVFEARAARTKRNDFYEFFFIHPLHNSVCDDCARQTK